MALDREAIFVALFARLGAIAGIVYASRIWQGFDAAESNTEQPALFLIKGDETKTQMRGMPPTWTLKAHVLLVVRTVESDPTISPSTLLNQFLTLIEAALERQPGEGPATSPQLMPNPDLMFGTTLGGLCTSCMITGDIVTDDGAMGNQGMAVVPIAIVAPTTTS